MDKFSKENVGKFKIFEDCLKALAEAKDRETLIPAKIKEATPCKETYVPDPTSPGSPNTDKVQRKRRIS